MSRRGEERFDAAARHTRAHRAAAVGWPGCLGRSTGFDLDPACPGPLGLGQGEREHAILQLRGDADLVDLLPQPKLAQIVANRKLLVDRSPLRVQAANAR